MRNTFVDQKKGKVSELLSWACDSRVQDLSKMTLGQLAETARKNAVMSSSDCDLEQSSYDLYENARPAGYTTQTRLYFGGIPVHTLIDSGASANVIPEEVAVVLLGYFQSLVREGKLKKNSPSYPLVAVEKYSNVGEMTGISAEGGGLRTSYALVLRAEFVPEGEQPGQHKYMETISFKILPKGKSTVQGIILGTPLLDSCPFGLGWKTTQSTHFFEKFGIHLPRLEYQDRADYKKEVAAWNNIEPLYSGGKGPGKRRGGRSRPNQRQDTANFTVEVAARCGQTRAIYDGEKIGSFELEPGNFALVPGLWIGEVPEKDFLCAPFDPRPDGGRELDVSVGICEGGLKEQMFEIRNCSQISLQVEPGIPLAIIGELGEHEAIMRQDINPITGEPPEVLVKGEGQEVCRLLADNYEIWEHRGFVPTGITPSEAGAECLGPPVSLSPCSESQRSAHAGLNEPEDAPVAPPDSKGQGQVRQRK